MGRLEGASTVQREREKIFKKEKKTKTGRNDYFRDYKLQKKKKEQW